MKPDYNECQRRCKELLSVIGLNTDNVYDKYFLKEGFLCLEYEVWGGNHSWGERKQLRKASELDIAIFNEVTRLKNEFQTLNQAYLVLRNSALKKLTYEEKEMLGLT